LDGKEIDFTQYKGKKLLIVNTASKCGKTPQYAGLEKLHEQFGSKVDVLGFPANNFLWQEPGTNEEIAAFCEKNYGVQFQMFEKVSVKGRISIHISVQTKTGKQH
jgi:glutathione peroxidase